MPTPVSGKHTLLCEEVKLIKYHFRTTQGGGPQTPRFILEDLHLTGNLLGTLRFIRELILDNNNNQLFSSVVFWSNIEVPYGSFYASLIVSYDVQLCSMCKSLVLCL